jgi:hypothetical protein
MSSSPGERRCAAVFDMSGCRAEGIPQVTLCVLIGAMAGLTIFYVLFFGRLLCPEYNYAVRDS